jgi:hypothetical protein
MREARRVIAPPVGVQVSAYAVRVREKSEPSRRSVAFA